MTRRAPSRNAQDARLLRVALSRRDYVAARVIGARMTPCGLTAGREPTTARASVWCVTCGQAHPCDC